MTNKKRLARFGVIAASFMMILALGVAVWAMNDTNWKVGGTLKYFNEFKVDVSARGVAMNSTAFGSINSSSFGSAAVVSAADYEIDLGSNIILCQGEVYAIEITMDFSDVDATAFSGLNFAITLTGGTNKITLAGLNDITSGTVASGDYTSYNTPIFICLRPDDTGSNWVEAFEVTVTFTKA